MSSIGLTEWECREIAEETKKMGCPKCGYSHPPDGVCLEPVTRIRPFGLSFDVLDKIRSVVMKAWESYGDDDGPTCDRIRKDGLWNDHIAVQAGIAAYKMEDPVTGLTLAQRERLEMLAEEAAEVVKACTKVLRHGYHSYNPDVPNHASNGDDLERELMDLWVVAERMMAENDIRRLNFYDTVQRWMKKLRYTHHQPEFHHPLDGKPR